MSASIAADVLGGLVAVAYAFLGASKILATADMRKRAERVNMSTSAYRYIGMLEVAAAIGIGVGYAWTPAGLAAGIGLVLLMVGAFVAHLRIKAPAAETAAPVVFAGLVAAYLVATGVS